MKIDRSRLKKCTSEVVSILHNKYFNENWLIKIYIKWNLRKDYTISFVYVYVYVITYLYINACVYNYFNHSKRNFDIVSIYKLISINCTLCLGIKVSNTHAYFIYI